MRTLFSRPRTKNLSNVIPHVLAVPGLDARAMERRERLRPLFLSETCPRKTLENFHAPGAKKSLNACRYSSSFGGNLRTQLAPYRPTYVIFRPSIHGGEGEQISRRPPALTIRFIFGDPWTSTSRAGSRSTLGSPQTAKRTLISRFNFYHTLRRREIKIQFLSHHLDGDFGGVFGKILPSKVPCLLLLHTDLRAP